MTIVKRIMSLKPQQDNNANRIIIVLVGADSIEHTFSVNQRILNRYSTAEELKADIDKWTLANLGYVVADLHVHLNRDGTWTIAAGIIPDVWPEDEIQQ